MAEKLDQRIQQYNRLYSAAVRAFRTDPKAAEDLYRKAIPIAPVPDDALYGLALALEGQGKTSEALSAYRSLIAPNTSWDSTLKRDPTVLLRYSLAAGQKGTWTEAVSAYTAAATSLNNGGHQAVLPALPTDFSPQMRRPADLAAMAHVGLGIPLVNRGKNDAALAEFAQATKLRPNSALAQFYHGYGLKSVGRTEQAAIAFRRAAQGGRGAVKAAAEKQLR
jgi:tetratricopeptide (TPR) repeat protein